MVTIRNSAFIAVLALLFTNSASAQTTTYEYIGKVMTGPGGDSVPLDGTVTLAAPLAPNLSNVSVSPTNALFGIAMPGAGGMLISPGLYSDASGSARTLEFSNLTFSTDSTGAISGWDLMMRGTDTPESGMGFTATSTSSGDSAQFVVEAFNQGQGIHENFVNSSSGSWSGPLTAPEIDVGSATTALTLLAGFIAVITGRRRLVLPERTAAVI